MSVYVDDQLCDAAVRNGQHVVRGRWSQLMADTTSELLEFASRLGLHPSWIRAADTAMEHFYVTAGKRLRALELGAVAVSSTEALHLMSAKRAGSVVDLQLLRTNPTAFRALIEQHTTALQAAAPSGGPRRVRLVPRGQVLDPGTVNVAAPTKWANPYRPAARTPLASAAALEHFRAYLARNPPLVDQARAELANRNLGCSCPLQLPCHADVWLAIANDPAPDLVAGARLTHNAGRRVHALTEQGRPN